MQGGGPGNQGGGPGMQGGGPGNQGGGPGMQGGGPGNQGGGPGMQGGGPGMQGGGPPNMQGGGPGMQGGGPGNRGGGPGMMGGMGGGNPEIQPSTSWMTIKPQLKATLDLTEEGKDPVLLSEAYDVDVLKEMGEWTNKDLGGDAKTEYSALAGTLRSVEPSRLIARVSIYLKNDNYAKTLGDLGRTAWALGVCLGLEMEFGVKATVGGQQGGGWGNQGGFNQMGGPQGGFNQMGGPPGGFNQQGGPPGNQQGGFNQQGGPPGNQQGGFNQQGGPPGNQQGGFNQQGGPPGNQQGGFNQQGGPPGNQQGGFNQQGGPQGGFNQRGGQPGGGGDPGNPGALSTVTPLQSGNALGFTIDVALDRETSYKKLLMALHAEMITRKGKAEMIGAKPRIHELAAALKGYATEKKQFPQGAFPRQAGPERAGVPYPPDQRVSWMVEMLPRLARGEYVELYDAIDKSKSWRDPDNLLCATALVAQFLNPYSAEKSWWVPYPGLKRAVAATHFVGIAGVGLDAADYKADDPTVADKLGIFGYDRITPWEKLKRPENTIAVLQVPYDFKTSWMAGGGSTVRGVAEEDAIHPFVCEAYKGKRGTYAIMANGDVRFIPEDIDNEIFKKLCTLNGGENIDDLDVITTKIPAPKVELKTEPKPGVPPKGDKPADTPKDKPKGPRADFTITAQELHKQYSADKKATVAKYKGKLLQVSGPFIAQKAVNGQSVVLLGGEGDIVECWLKAEHGEKAGASFAEGQQVTVTGLLSEDFAMLHSASILETGKKPGK
jgi:hypothetical protein